MPSTNDIRVLVRAEVEKALRDLDRVDKELDDVNKSALSGSKAFGSLKGAVGGFIAAMGIREVASFAIETAKLAGQADGLRRSFRNLAQKEGVDARKLLEDMQEATKGTLSEVELLKNATQAKFLGVDLKNLPTLFEFARRRAQDTGQDINYLVESIVTGIGRKSPLILDNLGLQMKDLNDEVEKIARATGTWTGKVDDNLRSLHLQQAAVNIAQKGIAESGEDIETAATKLARLNAQWEEFQVIIGEIIAGPLGDFLETMNEQLTEILGLFDDRKKIAALNNEIKKIDETLGRLENKNLSVGQKIFTFFGFNEQEQIEFLKERRKGLQDEIDELEKQLKEKPTKTVDKPDPTPTPNDDAIKKELKRQEDIAKLINKLRLEEIIAGARSELQAKLISLDQQLQAELRNLGDVLGIKKAHELEIGELREQIRGKNLAALEQLEATHEAKLQQIRVELIEKNAQELRRKEKEAAEEAFDKEQELLQMRIDAYSRAALEIGSIFESAFVGLADSLADAATTGGEAWAGFFEDLKRQIVRFLASQIVKTFLNVLAKAFAPEGAGGGSGGGNLFGSILGGIAGAIIGGPAGAVVGAQTGGGAIGGSVDSGGNLTLSPNVSPGALSAPQISPTYSSRIYRETITNNNTQTIARVVVESIFPDRTRVHQDLINLNREVFRPDNDYVNEFLRTKKSEFDS